MKMSLLQIINIREHKYDNHIGTYKSEFEDGYESGWRMAYQDLREILEQNNFDMNQLVIKSEF